MMTYGRLNLLGQRLHEYCLAFSCERRCLVRWSARS